MVLLLALLACEDPPADPPDPCAGYVPGWEGWTAGFFRTWCGACHSASAVERGGAPIGVDFDSEAGALQWRDRIRARVLEDGTMPIGGGLYPEDLALLDAWLSCAAGPGDTGAEQGAPPPDPAWTDDEARAALAEALALPLADPQGARRAWLGLFEHRDAACPATSDYNLPVDRAGCTSESGWTYAGPTTWEEENSADHEYFLLWNDTEILGPAGERWVGAGTIAYDAVRSGDAVEWSIKQNGTWLWTEDSGWLGRGSSSNLGAYGVRGADSFSITVDGVISAAGQAIDLALTVDSALCPQGTGEIAVRDANGGWFALTLDAGCQGCGEARYGGRSLGQVCVNAAAPMRQLSDAAAR